MNAFRQMAWVMLAIAVMATIVQQTCADDLPAVPPDLLRSYGGVFFGDINHGYAFSDGYSASLIATQDGGQTWHLVLDQPYTQGAIVSVAVLDAQTIWILTSSDVLYRSSDAGLTLSSSRPQFVNHRSGKRQALCGKLQFRTQTLGWSSGCAGHVLRTTDGGETWDSYLLPTALGDLDQVFFFDDTKGIGTGVSADAVVRTQDGGATWSVIPGSPDLDQLSCTAAGTCIGSHYIYGPIYVSSDRGLTWQDTHTELKPGKQDEVDAMQALTGGYAVAAGTDSGFNAGVFLTVGPRTPVPTHPPAQGFVAIWNGSAWTRYVHDQPVVSRAVSFVSVQEGWIAGGGPNLLYKTTDGGQTLTFVPDYFRQIAALTPSPTPFVLPTPSP